MLVPQTSSRQTGAMWCFKINLFVVCFCLVLTHIKGQRRFCTTPNGETARCVPIHSCSILYDAVATQDQQQLKFLKESQCGYSRQPFVCCGSYDNYRSQYRDENLYGDDSFSWGSSNTRTPGANWNNDDDRPSWGGNTNKRTNTWGSSNRRTNNNDWNRRTNSEDSDSDTDGEESRNTNRRTELTNRDQGSGSKLPDRSTCGFQDVDRILDGQITSLTEFPWMALLQYRKKNGNLIFSCGGTLISPRYVLTAAHCVRGQILTKIGSLVKVRLGEYNTDTERDCSNQLGFEICNDKPVDADIEKVTVHPDYSDASTDRHNDIALIKLKRDVPKTDFIRPICLPTGSERSRVGEKLVVAGWGRTEYASSSPVKLKLWVPVAEKSQCTTKFRSAGVRLGDKQLCAGGEMGRDSCNGDSGGPLMKTRKEDTAQWYIEGIVSFGARCGSEGWPGIYTKVGDYIDWIQRNVN